MLLLAAAILEATKYRISSKVNWGAGNKPTYLLLSVIPIKWNMGLHRAKKNYMTSVGFKPTTSRSDHCCSTDWATMLWCQDLQYLFIHPLLRWVNCFSRHLAFFLNFGENSQLLGWRIQDCGLNNVMTKAKERTERYLLKAKQFWYFLLQWKAKCGSPLVRQWGACASEG